MLQTHVPRIRARLFPAAVRVLFFVTLFGQLGAAFADESRPEFIHKAIVGILLHDRGPISDRQEAGLDLNLEVQFQPPSHKIWRLMGSPYPHLGVNLNSIGDTSQLYAGVTYDWDFSTRWTASLGLGASAHNGNLHQSPVERCNNEGDCGFGSRVLFRIATGLSYELTPNKAIEAFYDHISHRKILAGENEGIDNVGIRFHYLF